MRDVDVKAIGCTSYIGDLGKGLACYICLYRDGLGIIIVLERLLESCNYKGFEPLEGLISCLIPCKCVFFFLRSFLSDTVRCNIWGLKVCMILIIPRLSDAHGRWNACYALNFSWFQFGTICSEYTSIERDVWLLNVTLYKIKERCFCCVTYIKL